MVIDVFRRLADFVFQMYTESGDWVYSFYVAYSRSILDGIHIFFESGFRSFLYLTIILASTYLVFSLLIVFRKKTKSVGATKNLPKVTVQIPTYNELAALNCAMKCIESDYPKKKLEIIIGDDSNNPAVSAKIDEFAAQYKNLVKVTRRGNNAGFKPGNLNHMLKYTTGEYIVIFDSDFLPEPDFIRRIVTPFLSNPDLAVVQGRWKIVNFNQNLVSILGGTISLICHNVLLTFIKALNGNCFLCGSAEAIRKKDLVAAGGWRDGSLTEDIECSFRLLKNGRRLMYLEDLECDCEVPYTFKDLCRQQMRWAYGVISAFKMHLTSLFASKNVRRRDKFNVCIFASGYVFSFLLLCITVFGLLSVISAEPAPVDWPRFFSETSRNILMTSGFIMTSIIVLVMNKKIKLLPKMIAGSFSVGLAVTYYVNVGILKAIFGRNMQWFMLSKNGNKLSE